MKWLLTIEQFRAAFGAHHRGARRFRALPTGSSPVSSFASRWTARATNWRGAARSRPPRRKAADLDKEADSKQRSARSARRDSLRDSYVEQAIKKREEATAARGHAARHGDADAKAQKHVHSAEAKLRNAEQREANKLADNCRSRTGGRVPRDHRQLVNTSPLMSWPGRCRYADSDCPAWRDSRIKT
jgi:hypothetical protein